MCVFYGYFKTEVDIWSFCQYFEVVFLFPVSMVKSDYMHLTDALLTLAGDWRLHCSVRCKKVA